MFNVRLAGGHLYGKQLLNWLSLGVSLMASFVLSFFPLDVLDEIWDLIESVSDGFLIPTLTEAEGTGKSWLHFGRLTEAEGTDKSWLHFGRLTEAEGTD